MNIILTAFTSRAETVLWALAREQCLPGGAQYRDLQSTRLVSARRILSIEVTPQQADELLAIGVLRNVTFLPFTIDEHGFAAVRKESR